MHYNRRVKSKGTTRYYCQREQAQLQPLTPHALEPLKSNQLSKQEAWPPCLQRWHHINHFPCSNTFCSSRSSWESFSWIVEFWMALVAAADGGGVSSVTTECSISRRLAITFSSICEDFNSQMDQFQCIDERSYAKIQQISPADLIVQWKKGKHSISEGVFYN